MRRTHADRQRRRTLVDISVTATTPVTEPGPVQQHPLHPTAPASTPPRREPEVAE
ncbi:hypothetical protein [Streptomyces sp. NPDC006355]|uniref:hypothetical protein n=1 Tax=Streptomyces sp. NPDC006355 TaxID=3156758 RepID=UPI0033A7D6F1